MTTVNQGVNGGSITTETILFPAPLTRIKNIYVTDFGAVGDGVKDDTLSIQKAFDWANTLRLSINSDITGVAGYIGYSKPLIIFPTGHYICGKINTYSVIDIISEGKVVIQSLTGTCQNPLGFFSDDRVIDIVVKGITFLYYDTVFRWQTANNDMSFMTVEDCSVAYCNIFIDTVSFAVSRSTTFKMSRCKISYGVKTVAKIYCDKSVIEDCWFNHNSNSYLFIIDSYCEFRGNMIVPTTSPTYESRAVIFFSASDSCRSFTAENCRFGGEAGQSAIIAIGDVNKNLISNVYRNQGVTFRECFLSSMHGYNPDGIGSVTANVIMQHTSANTCIQFLKFEDCYAGPDMVKGIVQYYGSGTFSDITSSDFVIILDEASLRCFTRGVNKPTSANLEQYVSTPIVTKYVKAISRGTGKITPIATSTAGTKKVTLQVDLRYPDKNHTPLMFYVHLIGQSDSSYPSPAFSCVSTYLLTISGQNASVTQSKISFVKLLGGIGGASLGTNADIISAHFGSEDTGLTTRTLIATSGANSNIDITIVFGTRIATGFAYVKPAFDFSLIS